MSAMKALHEKMAEEGLTSYVVFYVEDAASAVDFDGDPATLPEDAMMMQFWAEDVEHAIEQFRDAEPHAYYLHTICMPNPTANMSVGGLNYEPEKMEELTIEIVDRDEIQHFNSEQLATILKG